MSQARPASWVLTIGLIVVSCGSAPPGEGSDQPGASLPAPTTSAPATATSSPGSAGELEVIVLPDDGGQYPADLIVTCPGGPAFPVGSLDHIAPIPSDDPAGMLAALQPFLEGEEGAFWPQGGWHLLHESPAEATLVTRSDPGLAFMYLSRENNGWVWSGSSMNGDPCELQYTVPHGLNTVLWRLDPDAPAPGPETTSLQVLMTERECVSGREIGDRLVGPQVVMSDSRVHIAFAAEQPPGDFQDCQGNPETPYTVELPEPLGSRDVVEGTAVGISLEDYLP